MDEHEARLKRLRMRSWRRGTKEMDLILGPFADSELAGLGPEELDLYEAVLAENDQDLYPWITARLGDARPGPAPLLPMLDRVAAFAHARLTRK
ncbi:succinate dehydrogenase assembly factor 2 [Paracoccus sp. PS-1]|uniref:FAD assembly factor SdhE n=1 Tax=unclassified Paracoccus (in: a-proteobacteria) TaxID=2688777 RepID=UPI000490E820|nr:MULTISPECIES: succinate dehydrogenase assembly factor 2 [unclassified Paracoccus (in: a-proteobacteria)]MDQ7263113.1 succinate dehydrogenase assembly factor 2 [Paracoccus sp. PS1]UFM64556.1 succinate dehydrogenase assembly factor 2 [Paracoccus sp. MA]